MVPTRGPYPYQLLPPMSEEERAELRRSMEEVGYDPAFPVVVDERGAILDGHHRAEVATALGLAYPTVTKTGLSEAGKRVYAVTRNSARRHLTDAQRTLAGIQIEPDIAKEAEEREKAGKAPEDPGDNCPQGRAPRTRDRVAAAVGLKSGKTYERAKETIAKVQSLAATGKVERTLPAQLEGGEKDLRDARKAVKLAEFTEERERLRVTPPPSAGSETAALEALRQSFWHEIKHTASLVQLSSEAVAEAADHPMRTRIEQHFPELRAWMTAVEQALPTGLRRVG